MFGLRAPELIIILVVVLIIFGPKNLPKLGKSLGSTVKNIREGMEGDDKACLLYTSRLAHAPPLTARARVAWACSPPTSLFARAPTRAPFRI